jgi:1-acyl-sn-glycerol-3-phosphate acyltransferase
MTFFNNNPSSSPEVEKIVGNVTGGSSHTTELVAVAEDILQPATENIAVEREPTPNFKPSPAYRLVYPWGIVKLRLLARLLAPRLKVTGTNNIPRRGAVILTPNHIAEADPPYIGVFSPRPLWFMAKAELFEMGVLGPIMKFMQAFPVEPEAADRASLRRAEELLKARQALVIFPEGRIVPPGEQGTILPGAVMLALRAGVPVIPVGLCGTEQIVPYGSVIPRPTLAPVRIHFGKSLTFDDLTSLPRREARKLAAARLKEGIDHAVHVARTGRNAD